MQYFSIISQTSYLLYWRLFTQDMSTFESPFHVKLILLCLFSLWSWINLITLSSRGAAFNGIQTPSKPPLVDIIQCHLHKSFWISNKECGLWLVVNSGCCYLSTPPPLMSVVTGCRLASWVEIKSTNKTLLPDFSLLPYIWSILNTDTCFFKI